jgi:hypothetical protein
MKLQGVDNMEEKSMEDKLRRAKRYAIIEHAVRWTSNILVEVLGNHGKILNDAKRNALKRATDALADFQQDGDNED